MVEHTSLISAIAGISLFMFGMNIASENLQKLAANRIRDLLAQFTNKPHLGVLSGIAITFLIQSSGAVTSMLVGLGTAGVLTLQQVMSVIIGSTVGTTLTVQLISLNLQQFGMGVFAFAFAGQFLAGHRSIRLSLGVIMGFGMLFWGMELIGEGTANLKSTGYFSEIMIQMKTYPLLAVATTAAFTAIVHSSAATLGFAMSLVDSGSMSLTDAMYWVYGANIGTTATALMAAAGSNFIGRQVAWAHCFYKVISVLIFYFFTDWFAVGIESGSALRDVANAHTIFNVLNALIFYFFINRGAEAIARLFPPREQDMKFSPKYINRSTFESPSVSLALAQREIMRMGDIVVGMAKDVLKLLHEQNPELEASIMERDNNVDLLNREINLYLAPIFESNVTGQGPALRLMSMAADLESAADVIDNSLLSLARKKHSLKVEFSAKGWAEIEKLHDRVIQVAEMSLSCFQMADGSLAKAVIEKKRQIRQFEKELRESHLSRLASRDSSSINTSSIHLDVLSDLRRFVGLVSNHAYSLLDEHQDKLNRDREG